MNQPRLLTTSCLVLGWIATLMPVMAHAQSVFSSGSSDDRNPFGRASAGDTSGLMQLINEAQIRGKSKPLSLEAQKEQITSATDDFRQHQRQLLRQKLKSSAPSTPSTQPHP